MNQLSLRVVVLGVALAVSACRAPHQVAPRVSPQMSQVLDAHRTANGELSTEGLKEIPEAPAPGGQRAIEVLTVSPPAGNADHFTYQIFVDHMSGQYWIQRTVKGGETKIFGPPVPPKLP